MSFKAVLRNNKYLGHPYSYSYTQKFQTIPLTFGLEKTRHDITLRRKFNKMEANVGEVVELARKELGMICRA